MNGNKYAIGNAVEIRGEGFNSTYLIEGSNYVPPTKDGYGDFIPDYVEITVRQLKQGNWDSSVETEKIKVSHTGFYGKGVRHEDVVLLNMKYETVWSKATKEETNKKENKTFAITVEEETTMSYTIDVETDDRWRAINYVQELIDKGELPTHSGEVISNHMTIENVEEIDE